MAYTPKILNFFIQKKTDFQNDNCGIYILFKEPPTENLSFLRTINRKFVDIVTLFWFYVAKKNKKWLTENQFFQT